MREDAELDTARRCSAGLGKLLALADEGVRAGGAIPGVPRGEVKFGSGRWYRLPGCPHGASASSCEKGFEYRRQQRLHGCDGSGDGYQQLLD